MVRVMCRMPDEHFAFQIVAHNVEQFASLSDVDSKKSGFIVAPFEASEENPVFLYTNIEIQQFNPGSLLNDEAHTHRTFHFTDNREAYAQSFRSVKEALSRGGCHKVVLARSCGADGSGIDLKCLFARACSEYPHCYVSLFSTPGRGVWLTATPELIYQQTGSDAYTKALAGTMAWEDVENGTLWSLKNQREQQIVSDYITQTLKAHGISYEASAPHNVKAAHLAHICSDIHIRKAQNLSAIDMLRTLHPTPAVAGIPLHSALRTIEQSEGHGFRTYYAGFSGFLNHKVLGTRCFVSLRLLRLAPNQRITLYAGGGILNESTEEAEWRETELKLQTLKKIL